MPGRSFGTEEYKFGFNGMECDDDIKGEGNSYTTELRILDTRLGKWLSLDPMMAKFPWQSPYASMDNSPIIILDPTGGEGVDNIYAHSDGHVYIQRTNDPTNSYFYLDHNGVKDLGTLKKGGWEEDLLIDFIFSTFNVTVSSKEYKTYTPPSTEVGPSGSTATQSVVAETGPSPAIASPNLAPPPPGLIGPGGSTSSPSVKTPSYSSPVDGLTLAFGGTATAFGDNALYNKQTQQWFDVKK